ncbi:MAG: PQQ-binding-like beta-propeller repeat protein [Phycisphaerales bacterium]|nr:PQQ-binding-like beta-propeller repeat protein [Phycisphaerales bacterium]
MPARPLAVHVLSIALLGAGLVACTSTQSTGERSGAPAPAVTRDSADPAAVQERRTTQSGGVTIVHDDWRQIGYRWDWTGYPNLAGRERIKFIEPYDDLLVVQGNGNSLTVIDAKTGRNRWSDRPANPLANFVGVARDGNTLFVCSQSEVFVIDAATGNWTARQPMSEVVNTPPLRFGQTLIFGTPTGELFSHRTDFGVTAWRYDVGGSIEASPLWVQGTVGAVTQDGCVAFLTPDSAVAVATARVGGPLRTNPVTDGEMMFVACMDQSVYAFSPDRNRHVWRYRTNEELAVQPTYDDGVVYVTVPRTGLVALDAMRGTENWIGPDAGGVVVGRRAGSLIVWDGEQVKAVEPSNGDVLASFPVRGVAAVETDAFENGHLYLVTRQNAVIRFAPR